MRATLLLGLFLAAAAARSDEPAPKADPAAHKADLKARAEKYLEAALPGVRYDDEKDVKSGSIERVFIVGTSAISTVLGVEDGLELAREKAEESAKAEFVKWLNSKVTVRKTVNNEVLLVKEGEEKADGGAATREMGKVVERRSKSFEETASSMVRGLKLVAAQQVGAEKKFVMVFRWESKAVDLAADVGGKLNLPKGGAKKPIPDKKIIIDD